MVLLSLLGGAGCPLGDSSLVGALDVVDIVGPVASTT